MLRRFAARRIRSPPFPIGRRRRRCARVIAACCVRADDTDYPLRVHRQSAASTGQYVFRRSFRRRAQFQGPRLRALARQHQRPGLCRGGDATPRIRSGRPVHARDRPQPLCLVVRAHRQGRSARQHLGDRQGLGHGDQVHARGPRRHGIRAQAGGLGRGDRALEAFEPAAAGRRRPLPPSDRRRLGRRRQRLYQRRLHQLARRQGGQGRQLAQVVG